MCALKAPWVCVSKCLTQLFIEHKCKQAMPFILSIVFWRVIFLCVFVHVWRRKRASEWRIETHNKRKCNHWKGKWEKLGRKEERKTYTASPCVIYILGFIFLWKMVVTFMDWLCFPSLIWWTQIVDKLIVLIISVVHNDTVSIILKQNEVNNEGHTLEKCVLFNLLNMRW